MSHQRYICTVCNFIYDESENHESIGLPPGMWFADLPDDWQCPGCQSGKEFFQPCSCISYPVHQKQHLNRQDEAATGAQSKSTTALAELLHIARAQQTRHEHSKSFVAPIDWFDPALRDLALRRTKRKSIREKDILSVFFEGAAINAIKENSVNPYWFWRIVAEAAHRSDTERVTLQTINKAINEIRDSFAKSFDLGLTLEELTPAETALRAVHGVVVLRHWPDHQYTLLFNPLFRAGMSFVDPHSSVAKLVLEHPSRAHVFQNFGIDYCCAGNLSLRDACRDRKISIDSVLRALAESDLSAPPEGELDWSAASITELVDHIENTHHSYLKRELPRLTSLVEKVVTAHHDHHPELPAVQGAFNELKADLERHLKKEDEVLFPEFRYIERRPEKDSDEAPLSGEVEQIALEHEGIKEALDRLRQLTGSFSAPEGTCEAYRGMVKAFAELESDLHSHLHKEDHILYPRIARLEAQSVSARRH